MLEKVIVIIPIIFSLIVRFLFLRNKTIKINNLLFILCIIFLPVGMFLTVTQTNTLSEYLEHLSRPTVDGIVVKSEIAGNEEAYRPDITYEYVVDSVTYTKTTSLNSPMFGNKRKQYDVAKVTSEEYPIGREVQVLYDYENPQDANLPHSIAWNVYGQISFGVCLIGLSLFGLLLPRKKSWL